MKPTLEQIQQAKQILNDAKFIGVDSLFSCTDIIERCKNLGLYPPNLAQQFQIIELINRRFDASIGINWDSIDAAIFEIMEPSIGINWDSIDAAIFEIIAPSIDD